MSRSRHKPKQREVALSTDDMAKETRSKAIRITCLACGCLLEVTDKNIDKRCSCRNLVVEGGELRVRELEMYSIDTPVARAAVEIGDDEMLRDFIVDHDIEVDPGQFIGACECGADVFASTATHFSPDPLIFHTEPICQAFDVLSGREFLAIMKGIEE